MARPGFTALCAHQWSAGRMLCVGLDSEHSAVASALGVPKDQPQLQLRFNQEIIQATKDLVAAYKPNSAFYEARGADGIADLKATISYIRSVAPNVLVIVDAKRADIGNTNVAYCEFAFDYLNADAVTVHPYLGGVALRPFLSRADRGTFVLCRTSNSGAGEFQDERLTAHAESPLYEHIAKRVATEWNANENCGLVVGATYPEELRRVREIAPKLPLLVPGVGAQGGDLESSVRFGTDVAGGGILINAARSVIFASSGSGFASDARGVAQKIDGEIRRARSGL